MAKRALHNVPFVKLSNQCQFVNNRSFHSNFQKLSAVTLPLPDTQAPTDHRLSLRSEKLAQLQSCLSRREPNPSRVWAHYIDVQSVLGYGQLPLEVHQEVLRKCTPSAAELRAAAARRLVAGNGPRNPHIHEERFQRVIRNIRASGQKPTLEDYHFILEQFAAVGHHNGSSYVYKELEKSGLQPRVKTFGLCLQAIAHRLTLPASKAERVNLITETRKSCNKLIQDMRKYAVPLTSVNLDLAIRILKETLDEEGFMALMKMGYGIDLAYPDRPPIPTSKLSTGLDIQSPQQFSTAALNTTIEMLGRLGNVSRLIQTFEVLTQPLPPHADEQFSSEFEDEDDFGEGINPSTSQNPPLPSASPNTTTYNMLLKYVSRAGHPHLARHYILQALELEHQTDRALRGDLLRKPMNEVLAPHFSINRGTLLSAFGEANRNKNLQLMRWISSKLPKILRRKRRNLEHYTKLRDSLRLSRSEPSSTEEASRSSVPETSATSSSNSERIVPEPVHPSPVLEVDLDTPTLTSPPPIKYFDLHLHIEILQRDIEQLESFSQHIQDIIGRTAQRIKERLGRRVWMGKDVYLLTEGRRQHVSRPAWNELVKFKPRVALPGKGDVARRSAKPRDPLAAPGWLAGQKGINVRESQGPRMFDRS